ncbi:mycothiol-dependent nitroreductase Rv2466c family protein [Corynebacterium auriscanis]|uniref:mycothiol-dependent nitroreductase Rv2466c family protein n=1 Tax=Corynebacterium auriscanis TaxID=99807 RepID=UPI0022478F47|nr:DsbA family protein [Corynebacterium auriscanis]MCX2163338.1 DsbA family protein [Corynebacterium auriscanis]
MATNKVTMFFDSTCPFAWVTSRWLLEVEKVRDVTIDWAPMSLAVLNDGREGLDEGYKDRMQFAWAPARVAAAVYTEAPEKIGAFYTAMGNRIHNEKRVSYEDLHANDELIKEALAEAGAPAELFNAAYKGLGEDGSYEQQLRDSHQRALDLVGDDVGTPVVQLGDTAFFGPVLTRVPQGEEAGELFDAAMVLGGYPHFFELKRTRTEDPVAE